jgi:hypothetical protein
VNVIVEITRINLDAFNRLDGKIFGQCFFHVPDEFHEQCSL